MKNSKLISKSISFMAFCLSILMLFNIFAFAETNDTQNKIGTVNVNVPYLEVEIQEDGLTSTDVTGKLGSDALELTDIKSVDAQKKLTYIAIDNSKSMTQSNICPDGSFDSLKTGITDLIESKTNDNNNFVVYSIGEGSPKEIGQATDESSAKKVVEKIKALKGNEDATNLNEALEEIFSIASKDKNDYSLVKVLLVTDTSADYSNGIDISEVTKTYKYNKVPMYTICNTVSENSTTFKQLRTLSRESGGEGKTYNYNNENQSSSLFKTTYEEMYLGSIVSFITEQSASNKEQTLVVNVNGTEYSKNILIDNAANIDEKVEANIEFKGNKEFVIKFTQKGFTGTGSVPLNSNVTNKASYIIKRGDKTLTVNSVKENSDGTYTVQMLDDVYSGTYSFEFKDIKDLSINQNPVETVENKEIEAKSTFWIAFPYLMIALAILVVLLAFYLILLFLKKKKNVKTIKELFITQVDETIEEKHYIQNVKQPVGRKINIYSQTSNYPQKRISLTIQSSIIVGRNNICDVYIDDAKMSRQHFAVEYTDGVFMISDLESANGTFVNGIRVYGRQRLNSGDMIVAGLTSIRIEF